MRNKVFIAVVFLLLILGISIFVLPQKTESTFERRALHTNKEIVSFSEYSNLESILKDQFPIRNESILLMNTLNKLFLEPFNKHLLKIKDDVVSLEENVYIDEFVSSVSKEDKNLALNKAYNIQEISRIYKDVKVYVYFPTKIEETNLLDNQDIMSCLPSLKEEFIINLGDFVKTKSLEIKSIEEYKRLFYRTDHHWNGYGAYEGYKDVINMIKEDFNIDGPKRAEFKTFKHDFYGSKASLLAFLCEPDKLIDINIKISEYDHYINGTKTNDSKLLDNYEKNGNITPYTDYQAVYGSCDYESIYDFKHEDKPNLLIFGDSYINPIKKDIASHFNKTIIIDLRSNDGSFNLDEYISKYNIDIILFLQYYDDLYFNGYLFVPLN